MALPCRVRVFSRFNASLFVGCGFPLCIFAAASKGKYVALSVLLPRVGALRMLELCPSLVEQLVWAVGVRGNISGQAVSLLLQFLKAVSEEVGEAAPGLVVKNSTAVMSNCNDVFLAVRPSTLSYAYHAVPLCESCPPYTSCPTSDLRFANHQVIFSLSTFAFLCVLVPSIYSGRFVNTPSGICSAAPAGVTLKQSMAFFVILF